MIKGGSELISNDIELKKFKFEEKKFLKTLKANKKKFKNSLDKTLPYKAKKLKVDLFLAQEKGQFYKDYVALSYDAEFEYEQSNLLMEELPDIIHNIIDRTLDIEKALIEKKNIDPNRERKFKKEFKEFKKEHKAFLKEEKRKLEEKRRKGSISKKLK